MLNGFIASSSKLGKNRIKSAQAHLIKEFGIEFFYVNT